MAAGEMREKGSAAVAAASTCGDAAACGCVAAASCGDAACDSAASAVGNPSAAGEGRPGRGAFVTLEGVDGAGKSTQVAMLVERLRAAGFEVVQLREPGGTVISEKIRALLLDPSNAEMSPECELLLFEASRAQLVREVIEPALERGAVVVCDRFYDSTHAYQAGGRGFDDAVVRRANELGSCGLVPDLTLVLDMDPAEAFARAGQRGEHDRMEAEGLAFQQRVRADYLALAKAEPARVRLVSAVGEPAEVAGAIDDVLAEVGLLGEAGAASGVATDVAVAADAAVSETVAPATSAVAAVGAAVTVDAPAAAASASETRRG